MARQENQARQSAWIISRDVATVKGFLEFAQEIKSSGSGNTSPNVTVTLTGAKDGTNFTGDPDAVANEISIDESPKFVSVNAKLVFPGHGNVSGTITINMARRELTINLPKGPASLAPDLFDLALSRFPPEDGLDGDQEESLSLRLSRLIREAESAAAAAKESKDSAHEANSAKDRASIAEKEVQETLKATNAAAEQCAKNQEQSSEHSAEIGNAKAQAKADQEAIMAAREQTGPLKADIRKFHEEIEANRKRIVDAENKADHAIKTNQEATNGLIEQNEALQSEIKEHLQKAVGASLFAAFQNRKDQISGSKWIWAALVGLAIVLQTAILIWLAGDVGASESDAPFYARPGFVLRALASIPIIFFIGYGIRQYARERDYEELYAFKSALSFSLAPYLDLVKTLSEKDQTQDYREFVVSTIGQIFENPRQDEAAKGNPEKDSTAARELLDRMIDLMEKAKK
ncbi:hypothetical protein [Thioalkalivibrio sp. ALM2T]|uniref:hypothetical protein n=1 Tax=Thioalkalivibrio sp. ALM2T TaxID=1158184 RepID=UPI0003AAA667|nr:hypothetical protein [Thioalkalivibrio sp. ALM2T]